MNPDLNLPLASSFPPPLLAHVERDDTPTGRAAFRAIEERDMTAFSALFEQPGFALHLYNDRAQNPLHVAILMGNDEAALALIDQYADDPRVLNAVDRFGYTPLMYAAENNNIAMMKALIQVRATVNDSHHAHCSAAILIAKKSAIAKVMIFQDSKCDLFAALLISAIRGNTSAARSFIAVGADATLALSSVAKCGNDQEAHVLIDAGADPSLALMQSSMGLLDTAKSRAKAINVLKSVGGDLSVALSHAVNGDQIVAARTLLLLGANGGDALASAVQSRDQKAVRLLIGAGVNATQTLQALAVRGDAAAIQFLLTMRAEGANALKSLINDGKDEAACMLIAAGVDPSTVLTSFVEARDQAAVERLIKIGIDTSSVLLDFTRRRDIGALKLLIAAGADCCEVLLEVAKSGNRVRAATLMAAGADAFATMARAEKNDKEKVDQILISASLEVSLVMTQLGPKADAELISKLLAARENADQQRHLPDSPMMKEAKATSKKGTKSVAALTSALCSSNWANIKSLIAGASEITVSDTLSLVVKHGEFFAAQLLIAADVDYLPVFYQLAQSDDYEKILFLIGAGMDRSHALMQLILIGKPHLARKLIDDGRLEYFDALRDLVQAGRGQVLRLFIPKVTDGSDALLRATKQDAFDVIKALLSAGADGHKALVRAISAADMHTVQVLMRAGVDLSLALTHALEIDQRGVAQYLILLGADVSEALVHALKAKNESVADALCTAGGDRATAIMHAAAMGEAAVVDQLVDDKIDETTALARAVALGNIPAAAFLIKNDAIIDVAMSQVTERDSVIAVRTVIAAGADPSRVLLLPIAHGWRHAMEEAMTAGADLSIALSYAIKGDARKTITDLLLCGADGGAALRSAVDNGRLDDAKRLLEAGLETHAIAKQAAEQGNIKLVQWLVSEKVYLSDVMAELAEESNEQAVKLLVKAGCDASHVLMEVVRSGRHLGAIRTLIDARADTVDALIEVAEQGDIKLAKLLIEAGANTVFALMHAMMADNTKIAAVLTAAGADIATAIRVIPRRNLDAKRAFFEAARQEVIAASQGVDESDNQELVGIILAERLKVAERAAKGHTESTRRRVIEKMVIDGQAEDLALLHAIDKLEWGVLKSLLDSGIDGSDLLHFSIERDDVFAVRLLMDAGVSVGVAGALEYVAEFESWTKLNTLLKAGIDPTETFIWLVEQSHFSMAKRMIVELKINTYETFDYLYLVNETYLLKSCLALVTDGHSVVTRAARIGDLKFLRAMIEAGADAPAALGLAISSGQVEVVKTLIAEGVDITAAMKSAVTRNRMTHPATFRLLGADLSAVLIHAAQIGNKTVVGDLIGMGVDGSAALRYLDEQGQWIATDLLLTTAEEQGLPI